MVQNFEVPLHQLIHRVWLQHTRDEELERVAEERHRVLVLREGRVLRDDRRLLWVVYVPLECQYTLSPCELHELVDHLQHLDVLDARLSTEPCQLDEIFQDSAQDAGRVRDDQRPDGHATDDQVLRRHVEQDQLSVMEQKATYHAPDDESDPDDELHEKRLRRETRKLPRRGLRINASLSCTTCGIRGALRRAGRDGEGRSRGGS